MANTLLPKQRLKDYCRRKQYSSPVYILTDEQKVDLHKQYSVQVCINGLITAEGHGLSRRIAEFKAAIAAIDLIGQSDSSIYENTGPKYRSSILRSFSVDHISRHNRTESIPSMMSLAMPNTRFSSAAPSIEGIDSLTENGDSAYGGDVNVVDARQDSPNTLSLRKTSGVSNGVITEEESVSHDSIDEGVYIESVESSPSPSVSSPTSSPASRSALIEEQEQAVASEETNTESTKQLDSEQQQEPEQPLPQLNKSKSKSKSLLSSFFMLSSLRAISRRSLRRKSANSKKTIDTQKSTSENKVEFSSDKYGQQSVNGQAEQRAASSASTCSSAFSSSSSISSFNHSSTSGSSTSGSFTLPDADQINVATRGLLENSTEQNSTIPLLQNGYSNLITQSIIEEEEEEENEQISNTSDSIKRKESCDSSHSACNGQLHHNGSVNHKLTGCLGEPHSRTLPRSLSSTYMSTSNGICPHHHFSIYGPLLCQNQNQKPLTIEATPSAALLRYCVRMYLPLPYYDIRFDHKFYITCRVLLTTSKSEKDKLPVSLPEEYRDHEFTARGNGETLRIARNMAAESIIGKLRKAGIYHE